jgi:hypothetical protein
MFSGPCDGEESIELRELKGRLRTQSQINTPGDGEETVTPKPNSSEDVAARQPRMDSVIGDPDVSDRRRLVLYEVDSVCDGGIMEISLHVTTALSRTLP